MSRSSAKSKALKERLKTLEQKASRSRGIFITALKGETYGKHPGYVDLTLKVSIYSPVTQRVEILPGKDIGLHVSSIEEVDEMMLVIQRALQDWIAGISPYI